MTATTNTPAIPLKEFDHEMAVTRALLERLPEGKDQFKPHEKSMKFGYLAALVASIPNWIDETLKTDAIDLAVSDPSSELPITTKDLLTMFDKNVSGARESLENVVGEALLANWSLKMGEQVLLTAPRGESARDHLSHLIHHRGQLSVYARLLDVKLAQIYGPTADTAWENQ